VLTVNHRNALSVAWMASDCDLCDEMCLEAWEHMTYGGWVCSPLETHRREWIAVLSNGVNQHIPLQEFFNAPR
jgi:hypothetical protein